MLGKKMTDALNEQINREMYSAYLYLAMSAYSDFKGLKGFANWFYVQHQEETEHAMRVNYYLQNQGAQVKLKALEQPPTDFGTPVDMFQATLKHEQFITKSINDLADLAVQEKDHATQIFLQWFVSEQIEEESNDNEIIGKLKLAGENGNGLFMIDKDLGTRVFTPSLTTKAG
ncbi:MAG: ferritin [bacterium]